MVNYKNKCEELIRKGVNIVDINNTYIDQSVEIGEGCIIYPNTSIRGNTKIGKNNIIDMGSIIEDSFIGDNNHIINSYIENSELGNNNIIGPFAHIHSNSVINDNITIGNFVEIKSTIILNNAKAKHLSYIGNTKVGENANIGGGVIIANYNPLTKEKYETTIEEGVCIGSNSVIVSPVVLKENSIVAAGSVITYDVPPFALAIARTGQINKNNYNKKGDLV